MSQTWALPVLERVSTTEQVVRALREAIIDGRIPQGQQLREQHLGQLLGASRGTIREALRHLVQEGLVDYELHRGAFVRRISLADRLDVYAAREVIETGVALRVLATEQAPDTSAMAVALEDLRGAAPSGGKPSEALIDADIRFHQELVRLAASPRLRRAYETLAAENRMLLRHHPPYPRRDYVDEHTAILEAATARDPVLVELVRHHLRLTATLISDAVGATTEGGQQR
jgi:DNA-binding GntR family transcriptional regulator